MKTIFIYALVLSIFSVSCKQDKSPIPIDDQYDSALNSYWKEKNESRKNGYLQLCALFKMNDTLNTFGKDSSNAYHLPISTLAATIGHFNFKDSTVTFTANENVKVLNSKDSVITSITSTLGRLGSDVLLFHDRLKFQVISRSGQNYLRVWDKENPAIAAFTGFKLYDINPDMIFQGQFEYYLEPRESKVKSQLGVKTSTNFIGRVTFTNDSKTHFLEVGANGFTMVADATSGDDTYGGGRYVYLDLPEKDSLVTIDFNKLYNPPCSFSEYTTCLYPPLGNVLPFKIEAGESITSL